MIFFVKTLNFMNTRKTAIYFTLLLFLLNSQAYSQINLISNSKVSNELSDWIKFKTVRITSNFSETKVGILQFRIYSGDSLFMLYDGNRDLDTIFEHGRKDYDTILAGEEFTLDKFIRPTQIVYFGSFYGYLINHLSFKPGNYRLVAALYDTTGNIKIDSVSINAAIVEELPSANLFPDSNYPIYYSFLDSIVFTWNNPKDYGPVFKYEFKIIEINESTAWDSLEYYLLNNIKLRFSVVNLIDTFYNLPNLGLLLGSNKKFAWAVRTYKMTDSLRPLRNNNGFSTPFVFKTTNNSADVIYKKNSCDDITNGFEDNTLNGWIAQSGTFDWDEKFSNNKAINANRRRKLNNSKPYPHWDLFFTNNGLNALENTIVQITNPDDEFGNFPVVEVGSGNFAMKLGNKTLEFENGNNDQSAHRIRKTFTVTQKNKLLKVKTALVLSDAHDGDKSPFFEIIVYKGNEISRDPNSNIAFFKTIADKTNPFFTGTTSEGVAFKNWYCTFIDLQPHLGQTVSIEFVVTDCELSGHFGYAYVDFCAITDPIVAFELDAVLCKEDDIVPNPENSKRLESWLWTIQKTNSDGTARIGDEFITPWFHGTNGVAFIDLKEFLASIDESFECNTFYNIKLAGNNGCTGWTETVKKIFISCPAVNAAGADKCCPNRICNFQIGSSSNTGFTYSWSPIECLSNPNISNPNYNPSTCLLNNEPQEYTLTVTDANGCTAKDKVLIFHSAPTCTLTRVQTGFCTFKYNLTGSGIQSNVWKQNGNTIATNTTTLDVSPEASTDLVTTVIVSNTCGTCTTSNTITPLNAFRAPLTGDNTFILDASSVVSPNSGTPANRKLIILQRGLNFGEKPAYRATGFKLFLFNEYGGFTLVKEGVIPDANGFANGDIEWDCRIDGDLIQLGVYHFRLILFNCVTGADNGKRIEKTNGKYNLNYSGTVTTLKEFTVK